MGGYIGARSGVGLVTTTVGNVQDLTATDTTPEVTIVNSTHEDTDGGREGKVIFKGQQSGGEETTLAEIQASHDGTSDDEKGDLIFKTNDGSDGASPTERLRIDSNGSILTATLGTDNVHLGEGAGDSIASGGNYNVAIGKDAGTALTTGDSNVAVGIDALKATTTSNHNVAIGKGALESNLTGEKNIAIGSAALDANTTGDQNVAIGNSALGSMNITDGSASINTAVGSDAGKSITTGTENTAVGGEALDACTVGNGNVAIGVQALSTDVNGSRSTAVGTTALKNQEASGSTSNNYYNTALGYAAGLNISTGYYNQCFGALAGDAITTGTHNVIIGYDADVDTGGRAGAIAIGSVSTHAANNSFRVNGGGGVYHSGNTSSWNTTSDERIKKNISDSTVGLAEINQIKARNFEYRTAEEITDEALQSYDLENLAVAREGVQVGCIAQELATVIPSAVIEDDRGVKNVQDDEIKWHMIKAVQELSAEVETLKTKVTALEAE